MNIFAYGIRYFSQKLVRVSVLVTVVVGLGSSNVMAQSLSEDAIDRIVKSTALIYILDAQGQIQGSGSGSLISAQGYVLTNYHVAGDIKTRKYAAGLLVGFSEFQDQEPAMKYRADVVVADPNLDLAILKLSKDLKGKTLAANTFFGEPVALGDSNKLRLGEQVYLFGFPGVGGYTITFSQGNVGGFVGQDGTSSGRDWIKHSANSGPGNSGGGLFNAQGQLIGIHTRGVSDSDSAARQPLARPVALGLGLMVPNVPELKIGAQFNQANPQPVSQSTQTQLVKLEWPPTIVLKAGQNWTVAIQGGQTFSGRITGKDNDGDWAGQGANEQKLFSFDLDSGSFVFQVLERAGGASWFCALSDANSIQGTTFTGKALYTANKDAETKDLSKSCTVTLSPATNATANTTTMNNTWPPTFSIGQTWLVAIPDFGNWRLPLSKLDKDGDTTGTASASVSGTVNYASFLYYDKKDDVIYLDMIDGDNLVFCVFEQKDVTSTTMTGSSFIRRGKDAKVEILSKICKITLSR